MEQGKSYNIKDFTIHLNSKLKMGDDISAASKSDQKLDIRRICSGFNYIESIDSPSVRCEFMINDTVDLISSLTGNEIIEVEIESPTIPDQTLKITQQIIKIGEITKQERSVVYVLYTVSPFVLTNEVNKVFKSFTGLPADVIVNRILDDHLKFGNFKKKNIEKCRGNFNFISPSWRAFDAIAYIRDKAVSQDIMTSGFLFFENRSNINFCTMDWLCSEKNRKNVYKYSYEQANVGSGDFNFFKIESVVFPDRADHLAKMRTGAYSNSVIGIKAPALTSGNLPSSGSGQGKSGASGSISAPLNMNLHSVFGLASERNCVLNDAFPFPKVDKSFFSEKTPTRMKIRALPGMKNSSGIQDSTGGAYNMDFDTITSSAYTSSRWQLLNAITLDIKVPGNVTLEAGKVIEVEIPASGQDSRRVEIDPTYSGLYLIKGLRHSYSPEGITTYLNLCKDSISAR